MNKPIHVYALSKGSQNFAEGRKNTVWEWKSIKEKHGSVEKGSP